MGDRATTAATRQIAVTKRLMLSSRCMVTEVMNANAVKILAKPLMVCATIPRPKYGNLRYKTIIKARRIQTRLTNQRIWELWGKEDLLTENVPKTEAVWTVIMMRVSSSSLVGLKGGLSSSLL